MSSSDFVIPMSCPSQEFYEKIWNQTIMYENMVSPYLSESLEELREQHKDAFDKKVHFL